MSTDELPGMPPAAPAPRPGTLEAHKAEWRRFFKLVKQHEGLCLPIAAMAALGVSKQRVHQLMDEGRLVNYTVFGKRYIACDQLLAFADLDRQPGKFRYTAETYA